MDHFCGIFTPICTPFDAELEVDREALARHLEFQLANGIHGIITCAGTGQFSALSLAERAFVTREAVALVNRRVPVFAHAGSCSTADAVALSKDAMESGADGLLISPPYYEIPTSDQIFSYFEAISRSVSLPVMVYNNPYASKINIDRGLLSQLCKIDNVKMLKEGSDDLVQFQRIVAEFGQRLAIFNGWDTGTLATFVHGAAGCAWGAANAIPGACVELYRLAVEIGDIPRARKLWDKLFPINYFFESNGYASSIKAATKLAGVDLGASRPPLTEPDGRKLDELGSLLGTLNESAKAA